MSTSTASAMIFQTLANGLEWWVALRVPALAVCKSAKQSVRNWGGNGTCVGTMRGRFFGCGGGSCVVVVVCIDGGAEGTVIPIRSTSDLTKQ